MSSDTPTLDCRWLDACIIAYHITNQHIPRDAPHYNQIGFKSGTAPLVFAVGPELIDAGFVAETEDDWVLVVFRGTLPPFSGDFWAWIRDWLNDFRLGPMVWTVDGRDVGHVETGFGSAVETVWPSVKGFLNGIDMTTKKGIIVSGHSKGGGMTFPAATWVKAMYPDVPVQVCAFAPPLTCDRAFQSYYDGIGLTSTVRYQNQYDIIPFLPDYPIWSLLAAAERRDRGTNQVMVPANWPDLENDYVLLGRLRYLGDGCRVEYGEQGQDDADQAVRYALEHLEFKTIVEAHAANGRYHSCVCGSETSRS